MLTTSFFAVTALAVTHIFINKLKLSGIPRSKWLSVAGGISVTYIFLQAFPELNEIQHEVNQKESFLFPLVNELEVYILSLLGLVFFYGLENRAKKSKKSRRKPGDDEEEKDLNIFWIHISSFAIYNFIIAYLLVNREEDSVTSLILYTVAMAFHLIVTDQSLEDHFSKVYRKKGRWLLVTALFLGWGSSIFMDFSEALIGAIFSFIAGGVIMNVLKEELPGERESNLWAFCIGVVLYASLLLTV